MNDLKLEQIKFETETWKRLLGFLSTENDHLKTRFSSVLKADVDLRLMEGFEEFQNRFVSADTAIAVHKRALGELESVYGANQQNVRLEWFEVINRLSKIKDSIIHLQQAMYALIWDFHRFLEKELMTAEK